MDFYGGWKKAFGDFGLDVGAIYYYYPGSPPGPPHAKIDNKEVYIGGSWKLLSAKWFHSVGRLLRPRDSKPTPRARTIFDLSLNYDLGRGWGVGGALRPPRIQERHQWQLQRLEARRDQGRRRLGVRRRVHRHRREGRLRHAERSIASPTRASPAYAMPAATRSCFRSEKRSEPTRAAGACAAHWRPA